MSSEGHTEQHQGMVDGFSGGARAAQSASATRSAQKDGVGAQDDTVADPFDPAGVVWRPLSRKLITVRLLGWGIQVLFMVLLGVVVCFAWPTWWVFVGCGVVGLWLIWSGIRIPRWVKRASYAVRDRDLFYRYGLLNRRLIIIPFVRIQYVDINVGPIERQFSLASVSVSTAAPAVAATIPGLTSEIAVQLRDILSHRENLTGTPLDPSVPAATTEGNPA